jgi:hypothetical protein
MPNVDKLIDKMKNQPHGIQFAEAERVLAGMASFLSDKKDLIGDTETENTI